MCFFGLSGSDVSSKIERRETTLQAVPVTTEHWNLLCTLFAASSGINGCWCMWPLRSPSTHRPDGEANRTAMQSLLRSGDSPGLIAIAGEEALGWCALGPRYRYPQYEKANTSSVVWAMPCIYVAPTATRRAVARVLIDAAVALAISNRAVALEGPPPWWLPGDEGAIAFAAGVFLENGFTQVGPGARMPELRRMLA